MMRIILIAAFAMFVGACGNSGMFSSDSQNDNDLFNYSMVPSGYQKVASDDDIDDMASIAQAIKTLDDRIAQSTAMGELNDLTRMQGRSNHNYVSPYNSLGSELSSELRFCTVDTASDNVGNSTSKTYGFMPDDKNCKFTLGGNYKTTNGIIGPHTPGAPSIATVTESFTLQALPTYAGDIATISYSLSSEELTLNKTKRGETSRNERQTTITGTIVYKDESAIHFGMKIAYGKTSTKVSDRRTNSNTTADFRAGFVIDNNTILYQDYYQKLAGQDKANQFKALNGYKLEKED